MNAKSIYDLFHASANAEASRIAYKYREGDRWVGVTWRDNQKTVNAITRSLLALGVKQGQSVAILSQTRLEWVQCDVGIANAGAVTVGIYPSNLAPECAYILNHSDAVGVFVEDGAQLEKVLGEAGEIVARPWIVRYAGPGDPDRNVMSWDEFIALGDGVPDDRRVEIGESLTRDDLASIVYTSGTTGQPKGAMLTHENFLFSIDSVSQCLPVEQHHTTLLFLPLAHVYARLIVHMFMFRAAIVAFSADLNQLKRNMREVRPDFIASVPRIYEKVHEAVTLEAQAGGPIKHRLFNWAIKVGSQAGAYRQKRLPVPAILRLRHAVADRLVLHKVRDVFGGKLFWCVSGAAPLNRRIAEFFHACGIVILEGIGMTENTSFSNVNRIDRYRFGTVGPIAPGVEVKIAEDGEVLFRGPNVMRGYHKDPAATAEALDRDGWLHTGDVGRIEHDGHLVITDRKKDLIVTAGGKNIAPQRIERFLRMSPYISHAMAYGDRRKYIAALITLAPDKVREWAKAQGMSVNGDDNLATHPGIRELITAEVKQSNRELASFETVKRFHILPRDFTVDDGELTPTGKLRRKTIVEHYRNELDGLYDS